MVIIMNANVTSIFGATKPVFTSYGSADFDIGVAPLRYVDANNNVQTSTKRVIYRTDNGAELGVHGGRYVPVPPKKMIDASRSIILQSDLDTTGIQETIRTSHNGSRTFVKYDLPNHTYTTPDGDTATLSLLATTSFDGTWAFMLSVAAVQFACTNLQVFTRGEVAVYRSRHTQGLDIGKGSEIIMSSLDIMQNENELWSEYNKTYVTERQAFDIFLHASGAIDTVLKQHIPILNATQVMNDLPRNNRALEYMVRAYNNIYKARMGNTLWAVYNVLTDWSTHADVSDAAKRKGNVASVQHQRQAKVREVAQKCMMPLVA